MTVILSSCHFLKMGRKMKIISEIKQPLLLMDLFFALRGNWIRDERKGQGLSPSGQSTMGPDLFYM